MTKFELNEKAVRTEILQTEWMKSYIEKEAKKKAGADTHTKSFIGFDRAKTIIYPNTKEHSS